MRSLIDGGTGILTGCSTQSTMLVPSWRRVALVHDGGDVVENVTARRLVVVPLDAIQRAGVSTRAADGVGVRGICREGVGTAATVAEVLGV
jgi:hypothetical protein